MNGQALGLVETFGYIGAVEAADVCLKAANVNLIGVETVAGGLVTVKITGDVGAVKAAVAAAKPAAERVGHLVSTHVIPRPALDTSGLVYPFAETVKAADEKAADMRVITEDELENSSSVDSTLNLEFIGKLNTMKVVELRTLARQLEGIGIERSRIKFANRKELMEAILEYYERKS